MRRYVGTLSLVAAAAMLAGCQSDNSISSASPEISPCNRTYQINLPAENFNKAARALSRSSGCFIKSDLADTGSIQLAAVSGRLTIATALTRSLAPTHLNVMQHGDTLIVD